MIISIEPTELLENVQITWKSTQKPGQPRKIRKQAKQNWNLARLPEPSQVTSDWTVSGTEAENYCASFEFFVLTICVHNFIPLSTTDVVNIIEVDQNSKLLTAVHSLISSIAQTRIRVMARWVARSLAGGFLVFFGGALVYPWEVLLILFDFYAIETHMIDFVF